jgi:hypothetical protein
MTLDLIFQRLWLPFKAISIEKTYIGKLSLTYTQRCGTGSRAFLLSGTEIQIREEFFPDPGSKGDVLG